MHVYDAFISLMHHKFCDQRTHEQVDSRSRIAIKGMYKKCNPLQCDLMQLSASQCKKAMELTFPQCVCAVKFIPPLEYSTPAVFNALHQGVH